MLAGVTSPFHDGGSKKRAVSAQIGRRPSFPSDPQVHGICSVPVHVVSPSFCHTLLRQDCSLAASFRACHAVIRKGRQPLSGAVPAGGK
jgi:hypothetical protein